MAFETVHTMTDWYDGPRRGVAMVDGRPHLYESCWNDIDSDADDVYLLSPIAETLFLAAIEDWEIWQRWSRAYKSGNVGIETHPALAEDRDRHTVLEVMLRKQLRIDEKSVFAATAKFRYSSHAESVMEAEWTTVEYDRFKDKRENYRWSIENDDPKSCDDDDC